MKLVGFATMALAIVFVTGCELGESESLSIFSQTYDFNESEHGWTHGFAEYPAGPDDSTYYELKYAYPAELGSAALPARAVMLSGKNHGEDLFMYLKKRVSGLRPDTEYTITFNIELASDFGHTQVNSTNGVYLKAGASRQEPKSVIEAGYFVMNIDKGNKSSKGDDMATLGLIVNPQGVTGFSLISKNSTASDSRFVARSNSNGELWLIVGADSGFAGVNTLYYTKFQVVFSAS